jgi:hypothetical protein
MVNKVEIRPETWGRGEGRVKMVGYVGCLDEIVVCEEGGYSREYLGIEAVNTGFMYVDSPT